MAAFATPAELASHLQQDVDTASATLALNIASGKIRDHCGWSITQESNVSFTLDGSDDAGALWLPSLLVTAVASVVEDGRTLAVGTEFDWTSYGKLIRVGRCWTRKPRSVITTITHGYATSPDTVKGVCLDLAGRRLDNPTTLRSYTVGSVSETYAGSSTDLGPGLTDSEKEDLGGYTLALVA